MPPRRRTSPTSAITSGDEPVAAASAAHPPLRPSLPRSPRRSRRCRAPGATRSRTSPPSSRSARRPVKAVVGETFAVAATVFREGHDAVAATVVLRRPDGVESSRPRCGSWAPGPAGTAPVTVTVLGEAGRTPSRRGATRSRPGGTAPRSRCPPASTSSSSCRRARCCSSARSRACRAARRASPLKAALAALKDRDAPGAGAARRRARPAPSPRCSSQHPLREHVTASVAVPVLRRARARAGRQLVRVLPALGGRHARPAALGHVRAPPPSGCPPSPRWASTSSTCRRSTRSARTHRKGRNNTLTPGPDDPGVPWAIGSAEGGHDAVHPDLGTLDDFRAFVAPRERARPRGRARPRAAVLARPPVGHRAPRVVRAPRRRHDRLRREPAEEVPGHLPDLLRQRPRRASTPRCCASCGTGSPTACGSSASTTRTPSRCAFWERLHRRGARRPTPTSCSSPRRSPGRR